MTTEASQVVGLAAALLFYVGAAVATPWAVLLRVRRLPVRWDEHPGLREFYARGASLQPLRAGLTRSNVLNTAPVVIASGALAFAGTPLLSELGICVVSAAVLTAANSSGRRRQIAEFAVKLGLDQQPVDAALSQTYTTGTFAAWAGLIAIGGFLGGTIGAMV